jgi:hypothetical protein
MSNLPPPVQNQPGQLPQFVTNATEYIGDTVESIGKGYQDVKTNVTDGLTAFSEKTTAGIGASQQFLNSNSIVAKFAFVILVILIFLFLLGLGINMVQYFLNPGKNPYLVKGMIQGSAGLTIYQDPTQKKAVTLQRSNNQKTGIEFTWSVWIYITDFNTSSTEFQHIFNKGDNTYSQEYKPLSKSTIKYTGIAAINNAPGLYISPGLSTNDVCPPGSLFIVMNTTGSDTTASSSDTILTVPNIPLNKWVNVIIRMENLMLDIYINGVITERMVLQNVPKQNYFDVQVCKNRGFNGNLSNLRYYDKALSVIQINNIVYWGPNTSASKVNSSTKGGYDYLSSTWYTGMSV